MGGGYYDGDVAERTRTVTTNIFEFQGESARTDCDPSLKIKGKRRECCDSTEHPKTTPIVVAMDGTRSRGDDAKVIFDKMPMFFGQIKIRNYVTDPEILWVMFGDATCDKAPLQVAQFESDNRLDDWLSKMWIEKGGGGTGQESAELVPYLCLNKLDLDAHKRGEKGILFILTDEGFYPKISKSQIKKIFGDDLTRDMDSVELFRKLQEKWIVILILPRKPWLERKADIDEEMRERLEEAGGRFRDVDIRASLRWDTYDDLDLHVVYPSGHIYYGDKKVGKGELDVDRNAGGRQTRKPVENIRWAKGDAIKGKYRVYVQTFAFHEDKAKPVPFVVELEINGKIEKFEGVASPKLETRERSDITCFEFNYNPNERPLTESETDLYSGYDDKLIEDQWAAVVPRENILKIEDPKAIVDVMLGAIALNSGTSLDEYERDMAGRDQTQKRRTEVTTALSGLADQVSTPRVRVGNLPKPDKNKKKIKTKAKRL